MFPTKHSSKGMNTTKVEESEDLIGQKAIEIARGIELQMAMKSAIELGILDTLSKANKHQPFLSAFEVAAKIPGCVNPNAPVFLDCMLSLLTSFSVLKCKFKSKVDGEKVYSLAPVGKYFLNNNREQGSMGPLLCLYYDKEELNTWSHLNDAIKEGGTIFERAHGMTRFEYAEKDSRLNCVFNNAMSDYTFMVMKRILDVYKGFEGINVLVDVGGGTATSIMLITSKYPNIKGINFDLPHVVAHAPNYPGVESVGGDMFEKVPAGDAIFLKWVLHNWSHTDCVLLLKKCWIALPSKGKVIIIEKLLPIIPENDHDSQITLSTNFGMYSLFGATEKTVEDYKTLAMESGFADCRLICSAYNNRILEFHKE